MIDLRKEYWYKKEDSTDKESIETLANLLLDTDWLFGCDYINLADLGWTFVWDNRKTKAGGCMGRKKQICLSLFLFEQNTDKALGWEDTIRHEIAHAIDHTNRGYNNHDRYWKAVALSVLAAPSSMWKGVLNSKHKYKQMCPNCERVSYRHRLSSRRPACSSCCQKHNRGRWSEKYVLKTYRNQ